MDFERAAYNPNEHNHHEWSDARLFAEENLAIESYHVGERRRQLLARRALAKFELDRRYPTTDEDIRRGLK